MFTARMESDINGNRLILENPEMKNVGYKSRMLIENHITGFLECNIVYAEGKENYVYDTTSLDGMIHDELGMLPLQSILITRIEMNNHFFGHLLCTEQRNSRIWQPDEKALLFYVAKCLAGFFERESL